MTTKEKLKLAKQKGFKNGVKFLSADDDFLSIVSGKLIVRDYPKDTVDSMFNGDIVSKNGIGCIYDNETKKWGKILK